MSQSGHIDVAFDSPANAGVLRYLRSGGSVSVASHLPSCPPGEVKDPYVNLGTHPELVMRLWNEITTTLPIRCEYVVYGAPVLVRPETGIIFAFAGGTTTYALRLPPMQRAEMAAAALRQATERADQLALRGRERDRFIRSQSGDVREYTGGLKLDISTVGKEWVFGWWLQDEPRWCLSAFEFAV